jgi:hypothetical protein
VNRGSEAQSGVALVAKFLETDLGGSEMLIAKSETVETRKRNQADERAEGELGQ